MARFISRRVPSEGGSGELGTWAAPVPLVPRTLPASPFADSPSADSPFADSGVGPDGELVTADGAREDGVAPVAPNPEDITTPPGAVRLFRRVLLGAAGAATVLTMVHYLVMPLGVLFSWNRPLVIDVVSTPPGAEVLLDGRSVGKTPYQLNVKRDRDVHHLEFFRRGYRTLTHSIRFDVSGVNAVNVTLKPEPGPGPFNAN